MTIIEILDNKVIPQVEAHGLQRLALADESSEQHLLPEGMRLSRVKMKGRRVAIHGDRSHGHNSNILAYWPDDGLTEMRLPFLQYVVSGRVDYQVGRRVFHCAEGDFLLVPPRAPFPGGDAMLGIMPEEVPDMLCFSPWDNHLQCCVCYGAGGNYLVPNARIVHLLDLLMDELTARRPGYEQLAAHIFLAFLTMLSREFKDNHFFHSGVMTLEQESGEARVDPIQRVRQYIKTHLNEALTIDDASNRALMSRTQFTKRFRQETGQSFVEYVTQCRLEHAKVLLHETDWSLAMISEFIGFKDTTRLRRIFDEHAGMSPSQYRLQSRQD